jgi:hypothetical protein
MHSGTKEIPTLPSCHRPATAAAPEPAKSAPDDRAGRIAGGIQARCGGGNLGADPRRAGYHRSGADRGSGHRPRPGWSRRAGGADLSIGHLLATCPGPACPTAPAPSPRDMTAAKIAQLHGPDARCQVQLALVTLKRTTRPVQELLTSTSVPGSPANSASSCPRRISRTLSPSPQCSSRTSGPSRAS